MKPVVTESRFDFRGGRNTAISPDLLNANELVDCTNARLSSVYGGFSKRTGSQRIHQTAFGAISGITQWDSPSGKQVVVVSNGQLWYRNGFDFTVPFAQAATLTAARTTINQGVTCGWIDPDGVDNGKNSISQVGPGTNTVLAANRLYNKLGDPAIDGNIPSVDNNYTLTGLKVTVDSTLITTPLAFAFISFEASLDNGATWLPTGATLQFEAVAGSSSTYTIPPTVFNIGTSATIHVWLRIILSAFVPPGGAGTVTVTTQVFNTVYKTDNYPITWYTGAAPLSTVPAFFAPFRASTAGAPLVLFIASGGHYYSWDGVSVLTQLDAPPNTNQTPLASNIIAYHTRMFAMSASSTSPGLFPKTLFWSKIGDATDYRTGDKTQGGSAVTDFLTGQQLTALEVIGSSLLMSTADSIMRFTGHASDDIVISQDTEGISAEVGAIGLQALKRYENVAAMMTDRGPYVVTETYAQPSGEQLNPDWQALDTANLPKASIEYNRFRKELLFAVPRVGDGGTPKTIFSQTVRLQAWQGPWIYPFAISCQCKYFDVNGAPNTLSGSPDGFVRLMDIGSLDDVLYNGTGGVNITMTVEIPVLHFGVPGLKKALKWMLLQGNFPIGSTPIVQVAFDGGALTSFPFTPNNNGEEYYRVDLGGDSSQGFRTRVIFTDSSAQNVVVNGFTLVAWNMQRTT